MARIIDQPVRMPAHGSPPKQIQEFVGRIASGNDDLSIARMVSPPGWEEPGQTPEFAEYTVVLSGTLRVETPSGVQDVHAGQAVIVPPREWVRYSTPAGAEYIAVCHPAFSPETVHRDDASAGDAP